MAGMVAAFRVTTAVGRHTFTEKEGRSMADDSRVVTWSERYGDTKDELMKWADQWHQKATPKTTKVKNP